MTYKRQKLTKREFLHQQYEKGRTKPQAEATWRMIRAVDGWPRRDGPKSPITRDQFIYKQRRKGRSYRQGAGTWKMMKGAKHWLSQYKLNPGGKRIVVTYEIYSYEDLEAGEAGERGFLDEEGISMVPDSYDREDGLTAVDKAVAFIKEAGAWEGSESGRGAASRWWTDYGAAEPRTGDRENRSYHLKRFSEK